MRYILSEVLAAWGAALFVYFVMFMLTVTYGEFMGLYWTLWLLFIPGLTAVTYVAATASAKDVGPLIFFALAVVSLLIFAFLAASPHFHSLPGWLRLIGLGVLGIPLGNGAVRYCLGSWQKVSPVGIMLGSVIGVVGVLASLALFATLLSIGLPVFIGAANIPTSGLESLRIEPPVTWGPFRVVTFVVMQGTQSALVAIWDTILLSPCVLLLTSLAKRLYAPPSPSLD